MSSECLFCEDSRFSLNNSIGLPGEESIIYQDENVYITPDIAPIVFGHFLIITKEHYNCFGSTDDAVFASLEKAKVYLEEVIFSKTPLLFFEHGSVIDHTAGCCIDHAHLHAVPLISDLNIDAYIKNSGFVESDGRRADRNALKLCAAEQQPYLYFQTGDSQSWYYPVGHLPSQFFRMMIASHISGEYNWKQLYQSRESQKLFRQTLAFARKKSPDVVQI